VEDEVAIREDGGVELRRLHVFFDFDRLDLFEKVPLLTFVGDRQIGRAGCPRRSPPRFATPVCLAVSSVPPSDYDEPQTLPYAISSNLAGRS